MKFGIEKEYLRSISDRIGDTIYKPRICTAIEWYVSRAKLYKILYYFLNLVAIFMPIIGSVMTIILEQPQISLFSAISSACVTILSLFECQSRWKLYRVTAEKLKNLVELYLAGKYTFDDWVLECEKTMSEENISWEKMIEKNNKIENDRQL